MAKSTQKNRKSKARDNYDEADNARPQAAGNIRQESRGQRGKQNSNLENTDAEARRDKAQSHD